MIMDIKNIMDNSKCIRCGMAEYRDGLCIGHYFTAEEILKEVQEEEDAEQFCKENGCKMEDLK